jgi:glycosyltransferase involved in cell wall biosynthesis
MLSAGNPGGTRRVLIFTNSFRIGGSERQAVELIKQFHHHPRLDILVACFEAAGALAQGLPMSLRDVHAFPLKAFHHPSTLLTAVRFLRLLRRVRPDVVLCFDFYSNVFVIMLARLAGVPVILGSRRDEATMRTSAQNRVERWCLRLATGVVTNSEVLKTQLVERDGLSACNVSVIENGLDIDRFVYLNAGGAARSSEALSSPTVAVVANLRPEKGHLTFLEAVAQLRVTHPQVRYLIAGNGPLRDTISARIAELGLGEQVTLLGEIHDIAAFLHTTDVVVLPSLTNEGMPNAVIEAMAAAKPVVATATGGTLDVVVDGVTGFLIPPKDPTALADGIGRLCDEPPLRRAMGERARARVRQRFSSDRMAADYIRLCETLLDRRRAGGRYRRQAKEESESGWLDNR